MIQVLFNYGGRPTEEKRIPEGFYERGDETLMGLEDYLIENGIAVEIGAFGRPRPSKSSTRLAPASKGKAEKPEEDQAED